MGSRIRENPERIFELFAEIARPTGAEAEPFVLQRFPDDYNDEEVLKSIPKFAFPCDVECSQVDHFTFVLTDIESKYKFGFCRHGTGAQTCLCIISSLPWYEIFYRLLNQFAEILNRNEDNYAVPLLQAFYKQDVPLPGTEVEVITPNFKDVASPNKHGPAPNIDDKFSFITPDLGQLPSIPDSRNLTEYYNAVDTNNMMIIFASMMYERRILITSRKLSRLTACVHGSAALIYPMHWQHLYIPVLPPHLLDYVSAPMPYLIGIHSTLMEKAQTKQELGDAVILDCDNNTITTEYDDLGTLPQEIVSLLKKRLKAQQSEKMKSNLMGDGVSRAFLKALVALIGGYRDALKFRAGEQITFDEEAFIQSRPQSMRPFLENMLHLQIFEQFIKDRLELLNTGQGFSDEFEIEANMWADKLGMQSEYKKWLGDMKERGKKLRQEGKEKLAEITSKVGHKGKKAYKGIRSKIDRLRKDEDPAFIRQRPATLSDPHLTASRPPRPPQPDLRIQRQSHAYGRRASYDRARQSAARQYKVLDLEDVSTEEALRVARRISSDDMDVETLQRVSINLMDDNDIQQVLKRSYSLEDIADMPEHLEDEVETGLDALDMDTMVLVDSDTTSTSSPDQSDRSKSPTPQPFGVENTESVKIPVPAPRRKPPPQHQKSDEQVLIKLDSTESQPKPNQTDSSCAISNPGYTNFDNNKSSPVIEGKGDFLSAPSQTSLDKLSDTSSQASDIQNNNDSDDNKQRLPVMRQNAFKKIQRPDSIKRRTQARDAQTIKEARKVFMESPSTKTPPISDSNFKEFDPLTTGQLAVDEPKLGSSHSGSSGGGSGHEEDLLKEWNLHKIVSKPQAPPVPPKPSRFSTQGYPSPLHQVPSPAQNIQSRRSAQYFPMSGMLSQIDRQARIDMPVPAQLSNPASPPILHPRRTSSIPNNLQSTTSTTISPTSPSSVRHRHPVTIPARPLSQVIPNKNDEDLFGDLVNFGGTKPTSHTLPYDITLSSSVPQSALNAGLPNTQVQPRFKQTPPPVAPKVTPFRQSKWETFE